MERRPLEQLVMSPERKMHAKGMNTPSGSGSGSVSGSGTIGIHCDAPLMLENGGSISRRQDERHIGSNGPPLPLTLPLPLPLGVFTALQMNSISQFSRHFAQYRNIFNFYSAPNNARKSNMFVQSVAKDANR